MTFEGCLAENFSAIVRPEYLFSTYDVVMDEDGFGVSAFGLTLGIRHYFKSKHRGFFIEPEIQYAQSGHFSMLLRFLPSVVALASIWV